jgi:tetratricopeptide (TPR) repeat protein
MRSETMGLQEEISELENRFAEAPDSRLFLPLADALSRAGEYERAVKLCREGLERYPDFTSARVLLGECLAELGNVDDAAEVLQAAAEQDPGNRRLMNRLAGIAEQQGDSESAAQWRDKLDAAVAGPRKPSGRTAAKASAGTAASPEKDRRETVLEEELPPAGAEKQQPVEEGRTFISHTLGDIYRMQGHDEKAYEVYSGLLESGKAGPEIRRKLEEVAARLGRREEHGRSAGEPVAPAEPEQQERQPAAAASAIEGEGRFEERIDAIFHFLLGDTPDSETAAAPKRSAVQAQPGGEEGFVDMLEHWIGTLREEVG